MSIPEADNLKDRRQGKAWTSNMHFHLGSHGRDILFQLLLATERKDDSL